MRFTVMFACAADIGSREKQQDAMAARPDLRFYAVADGLGARKAGEVASGALIESCCIYLETLAKQNIPPDLRDAIRHGNGRVCGMAMGNRDYLGMATTVVALSHQGGRVSVAHVGDSRCYRFRDGMLEVLTRDHSRREEIRAILSRREDADEFDPNDEALREEMQGSAAESLTQAIGAKLDVKIDGSTHPIRSGDIFLLCSDGLHGVVPEEKIAEILDRTPDLNEAVTLLVWTALEAGGEHADNVSVILIRFVAEPEPEGEQKA